MNLKYGSYGYEFEVSELKEDEYKEWDLFVEQSPQGTVFHKTCWLRSCYGYQHKIVACMHKKSIVAGIPLTYTKRFGIKVAVNPPFTPYLGVIFRESNQKYNTRLSFERELSRIMARIVRNFAYCIEYRFHYNYVDALPFIWNGFSVKPRYSYLLNLEVDLDTILLNMEKDTRNMITKAIKYNLDLSDASPNEMAELIRLSYARRNQKAPYSKQQYERFLSSFCKSCTTKTIIVKSKDESLAGGSIVCDGRRAYYLLGGINPQRTYKGTNQLVVWTLIKHAKEVLGLREFDFMGFPDENIERFIRGFGGKLRQSYIIYEGGIAYYVEHALLRF